MQNVWPWFTTLFCLFQDLPYLASRVYDIETNRSGVVRNGNWTITITRVIENSFLQRISLSRRRRRRRRSSRRMKGTRCNKQRVGMHTRRRLNEMQSKYEWDSPRRSEIRKKEGKKERKKWKKSQERPSPRGFPHMKEAIERDFHWPSLRRARAHTEILFSTISFTHAVYFCHVATKKATRSSI